MIRPSTESARVDEYAQRPRITAREIVAIRQTQEELGSARCPLCQAVLVARQGRAGPYFACGCAPKPARRAS